MTADSDVAAVEAVGVSKAFGGVQALTDASFRATFGQVQALVGENGAGKSTMIKILSGVLRADHGQLRIGDEAVASVSPQDTRRLGIATVFQELTLMPWMTVADNLLIDNPPVGFGGLIRRRAMGPRAADVLDEYGVSGIDPLELASNLSVAQRQMLEIVRALRREPRILFLDEPTAALSAHEVEWLFRHVRKARERGCCIIFTSHRWREVEDLADEITVYRNGTDVARRTSLSESEAVTLMTGRSIDRVYPDPPSLAGADLALEVVDLTGHGLAGVSLQLHRGEVLGIGGLAGQGQRQLFLTLFGALRSSGGVVRVAGKQVAIRRPMDAIRAGIALVPEDRKSEGLLLPLSVRDNLTLPILKQIARAGVIKSSAEDDAVNGMVAQLQIKTSNPSGQAAGTLSGGNQQKVLLGRWLLTHASILLLYDVTRGVDAATKHDLYALIVTLAAQGRAVLFYSSETEEVAHLAHRVLVLREGRISTELAGPVDAEEIVAAALMDNADV